MTLPSVNLGPYGKTIVAALGAAAVYLSDNVLDINDTIQILLYLLPVVGVYLQPNYPYPPAPPSPPPTNPTQRIFPPVQ